MRDRPRAYGAATRAGREQIALFHPKKGKGAQRLRGVLGVKPGAEHFILKLLLLKSAFAAVRPSNSAARP
jgi:hypothetical protein